MMKTSKITRFMVLAGVLITLRGAQRTAVAQKDSVPRKEDLLALGEDDAKKLLLLIDTQKKGKITKRDDAGTSDDLFLSRYKTN